MRPAPSHPHAHTNDVRTPIVIRYFKTSQKAHGSAVENVQKPFPKQPISRDPSCGEHARTKWSPLSIILTLLLLTTTGCDGLLLHPSTDPLDPQGAHRHIFKNNGTTIEVYYAPSPGVLAARTIQAYVLYFNGNSSRAESFATPTARSWGLHPVEVWALNYPAFGGSQGPSRLSYLEDTALATYDELARHAAGRPIFVTGYSMGTTVALYVATQRPTAGMLLKSPPPLPRLMLERYGWWNLWLLAAPGALAVPSGLNSLSTAPQVKVPAIFILSGDDSLVPLKYQQLVVNAYAGPKQILLLPNAEHATPIGTADQSRLNTDLNWLWTKAIPPTTPP